MTGLLSEETFQAALDGEFSRAAFVKGGGAMVVGFSVAGGLLAGKADGATARATAGPPDAAQIDSWVAVHEDNTATIYFGKINITGTNTGLLQIAAEELDLTMEQVKETVVDTEYSPNQGITAGSNGISAGGPQVRQAAAEARAVLLGLAATRLGVPASQLEVSKGLVRVKSDPSRNVTYGALLGGKRFSAPNTGRAPLKSVADYRVVGQPVKRIDIPPKVAGTYAYVHNIRMPGMLHGRVVRPRGQGPYTQPVRALSVDMSSIKNIKGVRVVRKGDFIGVVGAVEQDVIQAASQLKVKWSEPATMPGNGNLWKYFREVPNQGERFARNTGNIANAVAGAKHVVAQSYSIAYQGHASFGPSAGLADVKPDSALVLVATQGPYGQRNTLAALLGMRPDQVRVQFREGAGCYGKNLQDEPAQAAAVMSQIVGKPVRVQLTRDQEHGFDFYGPATLVDIRGAVDANGKLIAYDYVSWQQGWNSVETTAEQLGTAIPTNAFGAADLANAGTQYAIPNHRVLGKSIPVGAALPRVAYLRAPAAPQALFASEQMIDELAWVANMDPLEFRRLNSGDERWTRVLNEAAKAANWKAKVSGSNRGTGRILKGRGFAMGGFASSFVAVIADIEVDTRTGKIRVKHLYAANDCGLIVNPNLVRQQMEGCLIQGVSRALVEEVKFNKKRVTSLDWESYPILRYKDAPELTTILVNRPEFRSTGAGEPTTAPVPGAIANAFFDATGKRIRTMPMTPARVRSALKE
jgi:nicotinate dehydrogenase subunit B